MTEYSAPGVYVSESRGGWPPPIRSVSTSVAAFVGYVGSGGRGGRPRIHAPVRITSFGAYGDRFGDDDAPSGSSFYTRRAVDAFFRHGGSACFVVPVGSYDDQPDADALRKGIDALEAEDEPSMLVVSDAVGLSEKACGAVHRHALAHCGRRRDRIAILDIRAGFRARGSGGDCVTSFRQSIGSDSLSFGVAYYPWLGVPARAAPSDPRPPGGAIAGLFAMTDAARGVWKAPANLAVGGGFVPMVDFGDAEQQDLNAPPDGKSVNAIRSFVGQGTLVWGARTLDGNSEAWRYVPVRRTFAMVEEAIEKGLEWVVFEPNTARTWKGVKQAVGYFLAELWRAGALAGASPDRAYWVRVGLGETMTQIDVLEGRVIVEVALAMSRPAEFTILRVAFRTRSA